VPVAEAAIPFLCEAPNPEPTVARELYVLKHPIERAFYGAIGGWREGARASDGLLGGESRIHLFVPFVLARLVFQREERQRGQRVGSSCHEVHIQPHRLHRCEVLLRGVSSASMLCTLTQRAIHVNMRFIGRTNQMAEFKDRMKDYVDVATRITKFYEKYSDGSLQSEVVTLTDKLVVIKAYAYRSCEDPKPGIGHSQMEIPGSTPYTEGSEVENAETHAWGRALAALGFEVKKGVATRDEIAGKSHDNARVKDGDCPRCGTVGTIRKGREEYGGGWFCDKRKGGCGSNFKEKPEPVPGPDPGDTFEPLDDSLKQAAADYNQSFREATEPDGGVKATRIALIKKAKDKLGPDMGVKWLTAATKDIGKTSDTLTIDDMLGLSERLSKLKAEAKVA
jgi:hypothetical protein